MGLSDLWELLKKKPKKIKFNSELTDEELLRIEEDKQIEREERKIQIELQKMQIQETKRSRRQMILAYERFCYLSFL